MSLAQSHLKGDEDYIESELQRFFKISLKLIASNIPTPIDELTPQETAAYEKFKGEKRRDSWLCGREALKRLLKELGEIPDTASIGFPNQRYSLSHTNNHAVAVGTRSLALCGIGIDLEMTREVNFHATRFFLTPRERQWFQTVIPNQKLDNLLRLWTIKEALYKADPMNHLRSLSAYSLLNPAATEGTAFIKENALSFRYMSFKMKEAFLSIAISFK